MDYIEVAVWAFLIICDIVYRFEVLFVLHISSIITKWIFQKAVPYF